jgi:hypothetical protein
MTYSIRCQPYKHPTVAMQNTISRFFSNPSYAWDDPTSDRAILCDERALPVTENLELGLRRIREKIAPRDIFSKTIWIDAISINQADEDEKSRQVAMMGDIFKRSQRLIIWSGEALENEVLAVREALQIRGVFPTKRTAMLTVMSKPWFQRRWLIQELVKSPRGKRHALLGSLRFLFEWLSLPLRELMTSNDSTIASIIERSVISSWVRSAIEGRLDQTHRELTDST